MLETCCVYVFSMMSFFRFMCYWLIAYVCTLFAYSNNWLTFCCAFADERTGDWRMPLQIFSSKKHGQEDKSLPRSLRRYYKTQDELITAFEELQVNANEEVDNSEAQKILKSAALMSRITFFCNLV